MWIITHIVFPGCHYIWIEFLDKVGPCYSFLAQIRYIGRHCTTYGKLGIRMSVKCLSKVENAPCSVAANSRSLLPNTAAISINASMSSFDWKTGNFPLKKNNRITPAAHTSMATSQINNVDSRKEKGRTSSLSTTLQQHLRCSEPSRAGSIRLTGITAVILRVSDLLSWHEAFATCLFLHSFDVQCLLFVELVCFPMGMFFRGRCMVTSTCGATILHALFE